DRLGEGGGDLDTGSREVLPVRNDDVIARVERLADRLVGLAAHDDGLAQGELAEALEVRAQPPRQLAVAAEDAVLGDSHDEGDARLATAHTAASALMCGCGS